MLPDGYEIRSPAFEEVEDVTQMLVATDLADTGTTESDADLIRDQWSSPGFQPSEDAWVVTDPNRDRRLRERHTRWRGQDQVVGGRPSRPPGVRARRRAPGPDGSSGLRTPARDPRGGAAHGRQRRGRLGGGVGAREGSRTCGRSGHLQIDLAGPPPDPGEPPDGIAIGGIEPERDLRRIHAIFVEAFSESGATARSPSRSGSGTRSRYPASTPACGYSRPRGTRRSAL